MPVIINPLCAQCRRTDAVFQRNRWIWMRIANGGGRSASSRSSDSIERIVIFVFVPRVNGTNFDNDRRIKRLPSMKTKRTHDKNANKKFARKMSICSAATRHDHDTTRRLPSLDDLDSCHILLINFSEFMTHAGLHSVRASYIALLLSALRQPLSAQPLRTNTLKRKCKRINEQE